MVKVLDLDNFQDAVEPSASTGRSPCAASASRSRSPLIDACVAFPIAFYTATRRLPARRPLLVVAVLTPLWASYLVKAYAWRIMLSAGGLLDWVAEPARPAAGPGYGLPADRS